MTPAQVLQKIHVLGDRRLDYDDGAGGWFGWSIKDGTLTATFEPEDEGGDPGPKQVYRWRLVAFG